MKKVYILTRGTKIEFVSSNLKSCYDSLKDSLRPFEVSELISYSQLTRRFKKHGKFHFSTTSGTTAAIEKFRVYPSYEKLKIALQN